MDVWSQQIPGKDHCCPKSMFSVKESALGKGSCAAMPAPHCQSEGSSVVCCLGSCSTAACRAMPQWGLRTDNYEFGASQLHWVELLGETRTNVPASHCPSSSTLQRKRVALSAQQEGEAAPGSSSTSCSPAGAGVRCLARPSVSMSEEIVQTLHLFLMVGAQAQPCFPPHLSVSTPAGVLHPCGLPDHPPTLKQVRAMVRGRHSKCVRADFEVVQLSTAFWFQSDQWHCTDLHQLKTYSLLMPELTYFIRTGMECSNGNYC